MNLSGSTRVFFILGDPVAQVRAPEVFNHLFRRHGVDAVLVPALVAAADLAAFALGALEARNIDGLLLTVPHKTAIVGLLDRVDRLGRVSGAVNAVRRNADASLEGALFDGIGFTRGLLDSGATIRGRSAFVAGAGGAGVAISASLAEQGLARLSLFDPVPGRAEAVAARLGAEFGIEARAAASADPAGHDLVVNATPLGLSAGDALAFDPARIDSGAAVFDILMKNQPTPLLRACRARGLDAQPGFEMLVQQTPEYLSFFGYGELARTVRADPSELRALLAPR
ncbi:MAG: shikimate dehydrogenase [Burkholderiales bacterium]|nr:shikimate dehydrogenase [Burkholderiales bacterium]MDE2397805.1 shikimate dehydrogenase [Burkholderiales bacterium]MDE2453736.1 shikimate dehydrogenase [Burkholderiales bacterium]